MVIQTPKRIFPFIVFVAVAIALAVLLSLHYNNHSSKSVIAFFQVIRHSSASSLKQQDKSKSKNVFDAIRILKNLSSKGDEGRSMHTVHKSRKNTITYTTNENEHKEQKEETGSRVSLIDDNMENGLLLSNLNKQNCIPIFPQVVLYNRIFKTGSTSMLRFLAKCSRELKYIFKRDSTEDWSNENYSHPTVRHIQNHAKGLKKQRLLAAAHFYFRPNLTIPSRHTYINLLRDPVQRFISHYYYVRSPDRWPIRLKALKERGHFNDTIEECLEKEHEGCKWNTMTRFFCGPEAVCKTGSNKALERAKYNMAHYYTSVGVLEHVNEFIHVLSKLLPRFVLDEPSSFKRTFVTTGVVKRPITEVVMAKIVRANKADIELYNFAKKLFENQARQCDIEIIS